MALSRIDLADLGSPETIVQCILKQAPELPIPVPIEDVARELDIIDITELTTSGFEGGLLSDENKASGIILVNRGSMRQRQRFTVGHELGHFLMLSHQPLSANGFLCSSDDMRRAYARETDRAAQMEVEANRFAALILMPGPAFAKDMSRRKGADIEHILDLARRYDTSKEATARRYVHLHDEPCAAIVSHKGRVLRMYRPSSFPFIEVSQGQPVPARSLTARQDLPQNEASSWEEIDAAVWLPSGRGQRLPKLYEQVLPQQDGYRLTLLTVDADEDEEEESERLEESWTPRFRR